MRVINSITGGRLVNGKIAPDKKYVGITTKLIINWKPWKSVSMEAIPVPKAVKNREIKNIKTMARIT